MDSKRLMIRYDEDGGTLKDGLIELRRGVKDISLGDAKYSQVRILVDDTHYLKGMAVYNDNLPNGVDVLFNSNKSKSKGLTGALKPIHLEDPDNPFGSAIKENKAGSLLLKGEFSAYIFNSGKIIWNCRPSVVSPVPVKE